MIETKEKEGNTISFGGVTVTISCEEVFKGEGKFVVVEITNPQDKKLMLKEPPKQWRLPPGLYC